MLAMKEGHLFPLYSLNIIKRSQKKMLKKTRRLQLTNPTQTPSLSSSMPKFFTSESLCKLFQPPYRQLFQLEYLISSPLTQLDPAFSQLLTILQNYNTQTEEIENSKQQQDEGVFSNACMRFMYREMLGIVRLDESQAIRKDAAGRLRKWYFGLRERHSFLEGICLFKKRKKDDQQQDEEIRKKFVSNAYDEINDYLRKKISNETTPASPFKPQEQPLVNLPMIDIQLYRREQSQMNKHREKVFDTRFIQQMKIKTNENKKSSLGKYQINIPKLKLQPAESKRSLYGTTSLHTTNSQCNSDMSKSSKTMVGKLDLTNRGSWRARPQDIKEMMASRKMRSTVRLTDINGLNLIHSKAV